MEFKQYKFTSDDIAAASNQSVEKVRRDIRGGRLNPSALWSLCCYITSKRLAGELNE